MECEILQISTISIYPANLVDQFGQLFQSTLDGYIGISIVKLTGSRLVQYVSSNCKLFLDMTATYNVADADVIDCVEYNVQYT